MAFDKSVLRIQRIVDSGPEADFYCTDGYLGYVDVVYPGKHIRNVNSKNDTYTAEGINADLRHYIPILRRRSRCFHANSKRFKRCWSFSSKRIMSLELQRRIIVVA